MLRMYRGFLTAACAAVAFSLLACSGGITPPVQTVHCSDGSIAPNNDASKCIVAVKPDTVSFLSVSPANGSVITQSASACPMANLQISVTTMSARGNIVNLTYAVDGNPVSSSTNVTVGPHSIHISATTTTSDVAKDTTITIVVQQGGFNVHLTVTTATGERTPQGARAVVEDADSASFDSQGNAFVPSCFAVKESNAKINIRGDAGMIPFLGRVPSRFFSNLAVTGVPTTFTIPSGPYAGQVIPIHLDSAYKIVPSHGADSLAFYQRWLQADGSYAYDVGSWNGAAKYAYFQYAVSAKDSADLKKSLDSLNFMFGQTMFTLTDTADVKANGGVRVYLLNANAASNGSIQGVQGDYTLGTVHLQYASWPLSTPVVGGQPVYSLIQAEFFHTLATGHTCSWVSLSQSSCSYANGDFLSVRDVGYILLMIRVRALERLHNTRFSLAQAHQGERMSQGLPEEKVAYVDANGNLIP